MPYAVYPESDLGEVTGEALRLAQVPNSVRTLALWLVLLLVVGGAALVAVPWQQSVTGKGKVTVFSPMERPQTLEAQIPGRLVEWKVVEGDLVGKGQLLGLPPTLAGAALAYWEWVAAARRLEVYQENLAIARERADLVAARVQAGDLPRIDSLEAEQEVQRRLKSLLEAERSLEQAALKLAFYLWRSDGAPARVPEPESAPEDFLVPRPLNESEVAQQELAALALRPELKSLELAKEVVQIDYDLAANDRLPALDLSLSPGVDTGGNAIGPTIKAGLTLTIPLGTRSADGRMEAAQLKLDRLALEQVENVQRVLLEVRDVASQLRAVEGRYQAALSVLQLAREVERGERIRFELGDSTLFLVNQRERTTAAAELELIDVLQDYAQARTLFDAVAGKL